MAGSSIDWANVSVVTPSASARSSSRCQVAGVFSSYAMCEVSARRVGASHVLISYSSGSTFSPS